MALSSRAVGVIGGSLLLALGLVVAAKSCGTPDPGLAGVWRGLGAVPPGSEDPILARTVAGIVLTLNADGTFRLVDGGLPLSGRWRRKDDGLLFEVEKLMDQPLSTQPGPSQSAAAALSGRLDGAAIVFRGLAGNEVRLTRETKPDAAAQPID